MSGKKLLMLVGDFVEDYEAMVPYQLLTCVGHTVDVACPKRKAGEKVKTAVHDFEGDQTYTEKPGHLFALTVDWDAVVADHSHYDGLIIPGGRAPEYLRLDQQLLAIVQSFKDKPIASLCHGPQILVAAGLLKDKKCTAYTALEPDVKIAGGHWEGSCPVDGAVVDGNLVTAVAWPGHPAWMREFLKLLGTKIHL
ncbi:peptidase C56, PfpI, putative [Acanthamoeba castellanii str. Neff]|uniref:Peptidase C56, PfpI, putative n=1 Tax=Acanthamoeba castellanii (strain ATCC 30010 / Neff) TaxID=1257118 RepID=L8H494_ACACF|nr:peptidase C56, PfpI, putative [Acanthamoeba castellanii str. Neff]ELR19528.1 peptidase C56, PfpI, putative [Acanthamoeba castellanii str. Neff]